MTDALDLDALAPVTLWRCPLDHDVFDTHKCDEAEDETPDEEWSALPSSQYDALLALARRARGMEEALTKIVAWEPPPVVSRIDGRTVPLGVEFGSNGERDYFRNVARAALGAKEAL